MSADFDTKLVYDSRLNDISDKICYTVQKGAADNTYQSFNANSQTPSSMNFTVNPPSESTCISRHMLIESTVQFTINVGSPAGANLPVGTSAFSYGLRDSFQSFPLNRLFNTVTLSVNNVSASLSQNQCLPGLLRMLNKEFMQKWNGSTPTYLDNYKELGEAVGKPNSPMNDFGGGSFNDCLLPRGNHPLQINNFLISRFNGGAFVDDIAISGDLADYWTIRIDAKFVEPLFVSPMIFGNPKFNQSAFLGINNFQLVINTDTTMSRFWSTGLPPAIGGNVVDYTLTLNSFLNSKLLLNFLTAPIPMILPPKVALPYSSYVAYVTNQFNAIPARVPRTALVPVNLDVNSIQLEVVPDKLIVFVRQRLSDQTVRSSDTFAVISAITCTFGNKSGLLSNASPEQLWQLTKKNGCQLDYYAFTGLANKYTAVIPHVGEYGTAGSVLVIDPSMDFGLASPYLANGSVGQFNLQMRLSVANNSLAALNPEVVVIAMRSGAIVTTAGQSTLTTNMLNSEIVTKTIEGDKNPMGSDYDKRLVGGEGYSGAAVSGGARSGGARSAGRQSKLSALSM